jgi:cytochrome c peroxidase
MEILVKEFVGASVHECCERAQRPRCCFEIKSKAPAHQSPSFTDVLSGLWQHAPYFHDGSAPDLRAVVNHYDRQFNLNVTPAEKADLVEFLKSL